ncbi:MAG: alpha-D-ribose 1-methylphosphonate 5-triphosphate diphosphatase [Peptococcaceae bacterium]|nr:alpha-D-ribose 1-methylphosphonate 5-triphosphate diphosphatase [Peptococcaceae bacterium]
MIAIINGKIVTPDSVVAGKTLLINHDRIYGFVESLENVAVDRVVNAHGRYVMPGLIDVHSDKLEQYIQPRPNSQVDFEFALKICERDLLGSGITTMYHSISLFGDEYFGSSPLRTKENVQRLADLITGIHLRNHLIHHRFHIRIEIDNLEAYDIVRDMIHQNKAHQISFMNHAPGQGQYRSLAAYQDTIVKYNGNLGGKEVKAMSADDLMTYHLNKPKLTFHQMETLTKMAHDHGLPVASHDDDTPEKLEENLKIGVDISEFPITMEAAKAAKSMGFYTVVGAPNILRGCSHSGNMSATEAILEDYADILCSDYYPAAIMHSVFTMHMKHGIPLHQMVNMATVNPAKAMRIDDDYGSLEIGKKADILIVEMLDGYPVITHGFVDGNPTSRFEYRR